MWQIATPNVVGTCTEAFHTARFQLTPVILALPYDLSTAPAMVDSPVELSLDTTSYVPDAHTLNSVVRLITEAERPLILAGRGAREAASELIELADRLGALSVSSAPARGTFAERNYDLGVAGGFASPPATELIVSADVVLAVGVGLNQFTMSFGHTFGEQAKLIQIDIQDKPTNPRVDLFLQSDALTSIQSLNERVSDSSAKEAWNGTALHARDSMLHLERDPGEDIASDGRLDPRSVMRKLNDILPANRQLVSDGGHFIGWANTYLSLSSPDSITLVGTAFQSIGLGLPSAPGAALARPDRTIVVVTGDGGGLMGISDLETLIRVAKSSLVLFFNDAAYGAEVHQYGSRGLDQDVMLIPEIGFADIARGMGAQSITVNTLDDLAEINTWVRQGAEGTLLADLRVSTNVVAPYIQEIISYTLS